MTPDTDCEINRALLSEISAELTAELAAELQREAEQGTRLVEIDGGHVPVERLLDEIEATSSPRPPTRTAATRS